MEGLVKSSSGKATTVHFSIRTLGAAERRRLALKGLGICWGLALATLPLPPIHWVTVPFFFLFGFYWAGRKYREDLHFMPFRFSCPECTKEVPVPEQAVRGRLEIICSECKYGLKL